MRRPARMWRLYALAAVALSVLAVAIGSWWPGDARGTAAPDARLVAFDGPSTAVTWASSKPAGWRDVSDAFVALSGDGIGVAGLTISRVGDGTTGHEWGQLDARGPDGALAWTSPRHSLALTTPFWSDGERVYAVWERSERQYDPFLGGTTEPVVERLLLSVDGRSGRELWWTRLGPAGDTNLVLGRDAVLVLASDWLAQEPRAVVALDGPTGTVLWRATLPSLGLGTGCSITVVDDAAQLRCSGDDLVTNERVTRYAIVDLRSGTDRTHRRTPRCARPSARRASRSRLVDALFIVERQASALAAGEIHHDALREAVPGRLGDALSGAVARLSTSIADSRTLASRLEHDANHDGLTLLPNRRAAVTFLDTALAETATGAVGPAVLYVDLDRFKPVNDSYGHEAGDDVLRVVAARLRSLVRAGDIVARLGGDEFLIIFRHAPTPDDHGPLVQRVASAIEAPIPVGSDGTTVVVGASIGLAIAEPGQRADELLRDADQAMYAAKAANRSRPEPSAPGHS